MATFLNILFLVIGIIGGGAIGFLIKTVMSKLQISELENKAYKLQEQLNQATTQIAEMTNKLKSTEALLSDSLAAIELLKAYKAIDDATQTKINNLKATLKNGEVTEETIKKYQEMINEINNKNHPTK